jgi:nicotinate phosphoribosyltransferase
MGVKAHFHPPAGSKKVNKTTESPEIWSDAYFKRTKEIVAHFGDQTVTYAVFMRRPVVSAPQKAIDWLTAIMAERGQTVTIDLRYQEGRWVGAGEPILTITGSFYHLVDCETQFLMLLGPACVAAANAFTMAATLPGVDFLAMDARHCAGIGMADLMAYAASVGSARAQRKVGARGFIGNATDATAHYFSRSHGLGTMPHALIGYAGSTVRAAQMFRETHRDQRLVVLIDYFGQEITDALAVCHQFADLAHAGDLSLRIDTLGGRFVEGLDHQQSYAVLERHVPEAIRGYRTESELSYLIGRGVSAAAIWHVRTSLNKAGFDRVKIVASSGFNPVKCRMMAEAHAPIDVIGTGSFLPEIWNETYATADIIAYDGQYRVKTGREFLLPRDDHR